MDSGPTSFNPYQFIVVCTAPHQPTGYYGPYRTFSEATEVTKFWNDAVPTVVTARVEKVYPFS